MSIDNNELDEMDFDLLDILGVTEQKVESITLLPGYNKKGEKEYYYTNSDESMFSTSVRGHFLTLLMPEEYKYGENTKEKGSWANDILPIVPEKFEKKVMPDKDIKDKLKAIVQLCKKCDTIVNCGDADREGQIIVDEILEKGDSKTIFGLVIRNKHYKTYECKKRKTFK